MQHALTGALAALCFSYCSGSQPAAPSTVPRIQVTPPNWAELVEERGCTSLDTREGGEVERTVLSYGTRLIRYEGLSPQLVSDRVAESLDGLRERCPGANGIDSLEVRAGNYFLQFSDF